MKWSDLDMGLKTWTVARTTTRDLRGAVVVGDRTKTGEARQLPLADDVVAVLQNQRRTVTRARVASLIWRDDDLVFPTVVGTVQDPRNVRKALRPLAVSCGFPARPRVAPPLRQRCGDHRPRCHRV